MRLRPLRDGDEPAVLQAQSELAGDAFEFALGYEDGMSWRAYMERMRDESVGRGLADDRVPASFLVAEVDGDLVGRVSIRHELNEFLAREGGHIGFAVRPQYRRRGYASEMLGQALIVARAVGVERVLVTCDEENIGSASVIRRCGGVLESVYDGGGGEPRKLLFWID